MRWTYIIPRLLLVALLWGFFACGMDPLLRYTGIRTLQSIAGARADIQGLRTTFFPPSLTLEKVAIASADRPGKNLFEFDELHLRLETDSLSYRRFVVEDGRIEGLRFDTQRNDDGQLEKLETPNSNEPSWMSEALTELGDEWVSGLTEQVKGELDPDILATYRVGSQVYEKWDAHFQDLRSQAMAMRPQVEELRTQFRNARQGDTLRQIEQFIMVAERAAAIVVEVRQLRDDLKSIVPEVRGDFAAMNEARRLDEQQVRQKLSLLKPDARRISQALLGKTMYVQIQQVLTWVQAAREYQAKLHRQVQPERRPGRDFLFAARQPAPDFLLKTLALSGRISINEELRPFQAMLSDVTEDPRLLGRPCVLRLKAGGSHPLQLRVTYDATGSVPRSELLAQYRDPNEVSLRAGKQKSAAVHATLRDLNWSTRLTLNSDQLDGQIDLTAQIDRLSFQASDSMRPEIVEAANEALSAVRTLNASVRLDGALLKPELALTSDLGDQVSQGIHRALTHQVERAKERLLAEVDRFAKDQIEKLTSRFSKEYEQLLLENTKLLEQTQEIQTLVASLQSGKVEPAMIFRQVTDSKLISEKDRQRIYRGIGGLESVLQHSDLPSRLQGPVSRESANHVPAGQPSFHP